MRDYAAARELDRVATASAFNVSGALSRQKLNQHATLYTFADGSCLEIRHTRGLGSAWHPDWYGVEGDQPLAPVRNVPLKINARGE